MTYPDVMAMPIRTFWMYVKNSRRLYAEESLRLFRVMASVQSPEAGKEFVQEQIRDRGDPITVRKSKQEIAESHSAGVQQLKALLGR